MNGGSVCDGLTDGRDDPKILSHQQLPMRTFARVDKSAHKDANLAESDINTANGKDKGMANDLVVAILYELSTYREPEIRQHVRVRRNETTEPMVGWR